MESHSFFIVEHDLHNNISTDREIQSHSKLQTFQSEKAQQFLKGSYKHNADTSEYAVEHIASHTDTGDKLECVVRQYSYSAIGNLIQPSDHVLQPFNAGYWRNRTGIAFKIYYRLYFYPMHSEQSKSYTSQKSATIIYC